MRQCAERIRKVSAERINVELSKLILGSSADKVLQEFGDIIKIAAPGLRGSVSVPCSKEITSTPGDVVSRKDRGCAAPAEI